MLTSISGRTVIITGASKGIGKGIASVFARNGAKVMVGLMKRRFLDIMPVVAKVPDAQVMSDLDAAVAWAGKNKGNTQKLGITGFCWGGRVVWLYAAHNPKVKAGVAWYGRLVGGQQPAPLQPKHPVDFAATLKVPVLGLYAGKDSGIPLDSIEKMKAELAKGKSKSEFVIYPQAAHGFHADYRTSYKKDDAQDGWKRLQAWFKKNGAA